MRLEWVKRRLINWAAWVEESREGRIKSPKLDDTPGGGGVVEPKEHAKEAATHRALRALYELEAKHTSAETLALVYLVGPQNNKTTVAEIADWVGINRTTLQMRLEVAESRFANIVDNARDVPDKT